MTRYLLLALLIALLAPAYTVTHAQQTTPDAVAVVETLRVRGLPLGDAAVFTAATDPNNLLGRPGGYTSKATWRDTRLDAWIEGELHVEDGGSVEVYPTPAGAQKRSAFLTAMSEAAPVIGGYTYTRGAVVLRVSRMLTPEQAAEYDAALADE